MNKPTITVIGGGRLGCALLEGLLRTGMPADKLTLSTPHLEKVPPNLMDAGICLMTDNQQAVMTADVILLAVKPYCIIPVCHDIQEQLQRARRLIISLAAGVRLKTIEQAVPPNSPVVRAMPNIGARVGASATGLIANPHNTEQEKAWAESILRSVGSIAWCSTDEQMDIVTAISGSGPAYFFYFIELMQNAAIQMGLPAEQAKLLVLQTAEGASRLAMSVPESPEYLRALVTSKGGTTEAAFNVLTQPAFHDTFMQALENARAKAEQLASNQ